MRSSTPAGGSHDFFERAKSYNGQENCGTPCPQRKKQSQSTTKQDLGVNELTAVQLPQMHSRLCPIADIGMPDSESKMLYAIIGDI